jgi:hypothetical protein
MAWHMAKRVQGGLNDPLAGGIGSLVAGKAPLKTVGSVLAVCDRTLFDYGAACDAGITAAKSLSADEVIRGIGVYPQSQRHRRTRRGGRCAVAAQGEDAEPGWVHSVSRAIHDRPRLV